MCRIIMAGLRAMAVFAVLNAAARAGSVTLSDPLHSKFTKAEVEDARIQLYEREMNLRAENPTGFDHKYPVLGSILASEKGYDEFLSDHTFNRLLCVHTPFIWRVVAGDIFYHRIHPFDTPPAIPDGGPPVIIDGSPGGSPPVGGGTDPHNPGGGTFQTNSLPEPSSGTLMAAALVLALLASARRRIYRFAKARKPVRAPV
jgi:MYXO-CTERM domain-containing protein